MNEQKIGASSKRKVIWVGAGVAALAVILVASSGIDFPPGGTKTSGSDRACAAFPRRAAGDDGRERPGQSESAQRASQGTPGNIGDARSSDARASDSLKTDGRADSLKDGRTDAMKDGRADSHEGRPQPTP